MGHMREYGPRKTDDHKALAKSMRDAGKSYREISQLLGIPKSTLQRWIEQIKALQPLTDSFADNRITLYRADQLRMRDHITDGKLIDASARDLVAMQKQLWEMERVEAGKSTQNIGMAIYSLIREVKDRQQRVLPTQVHEESKP